MLRGVVLAMRGFPTSFGDILASWEQFGFFQYVLPFLLIFALVYGILTRIKIFEENKAINAILAIVVAFMSLQMTRVSEFFSQIFPKLGIGLAVLLAVLILMGLFVGGEDDENRRKAVNYMLMGVGFIIFVVILIQTSANFGWSAFWWQNNWPMIVLGLFILAVVVVIIVSSGGKRKEEGYYVMPKRRR